MQLTLRKNETKTDHYYLRATFKNEVYETKISYVEETAQTLLKKELKMVRVGDSNALWHYREHPYFHRLED